MRKKIKTAFIVFTLIAATMIATISGYSIYYSYLAQMQNNQEYITLRDKYVVTSPTQPTIIGNISNEVNYNFDKLSKINKEIKGWLYIPDTIIDFPVVQTTNNYKYLSYGFENTYNENGCPFLDYRTTSSSNSITIHGHNMGTGKLPMFSTLIKYDNKEYLLSHQYIYYSNIYTPDTIDKYRIFSVLHFNVDELKDFDYMQRSFSNTESFTSWINNSIKKSIYSTGYIPEVKLLSSQVLVLSTCDMRFNGSNGRYVIMAYKQ